MKYPEFEQYKLIEDKDSWMINHYQTSNGNDFYVEPGFYYGLQGMKEKKEEDFPRIMEAIDKTVMENGHVIFTGNYETPFFDKEGYIYREITDITDPLCVFVEDKSRGSDYGD